MGNQNSPPQVLKYAAHYAEIQAEEHPFFGSIIHLKHREEGSIHFLKIRKFATDHQLNEAMKKANKRKQLSQKKGSVNIVRTTEIDSMKHNQLCGITHYLYTIYEDIDYCLNHFIKEKVTLNQPFLQEEILQVMKGVCSGLLFLQDNGYKNYTISKDSIVKGIKDKNDISVFKVLDIEFAKQMPPYYRILNGMAVQRGTYLAPEVLKELSCKNIDPDLTLKSQIFCLGMVVLEMCVLEELDNLYDYHKFTINQKTLNSKVRNISYSSYLKNLLIQMLEINEEERIGVVSLKQKLSISDNKSTTDYGHSGIGSSNVTQRTHKVSYPLQVLKEPIKFRVDDIVPTQIKPVIRMHADEQHNLQENFYIVNTFDNFANQKNKTFDQPRSFIQGQNTVHHNLQHPGFNKTTFIEKPKQGAQISFNKTMMVNQSNKHHKTNLPFYYPPHIKQSNQLSTSPNSQHSNILIKNQNKIQSTCSPIQNKSRLNSQQIKITQINVSESPHLRKQPQTPINMLVQQTGIPLQSLKMRSANSFGQQLEVITSTNFNRQEEHRKSLIDDLMMSINEYESPPKQSKQSPYASNDNTPIRKVQALQSLPRNSITSIIKQDEQENQHEPIINMIKNKQIKRAPIEGSDGPKTYGKHYFTNKAVYEGEMDLMGNFCGNGVLYYPNGQICYSGGWKDNSFHGFGSLNNELTINCTQPTNYEDFGKNPANLWHHYEGEFCMDKKNGFGTLFMANGDKFSGCFVKDVIEGYGTFTNSNGQRVSGIWYQNMLKKL